MIKAEIRISVGAREVNVAIPEQERFWSYVNKSGPPHPYKPELGNCWVWMKSEGFKGYGAFRCGGTMMGTHRVAFILYHRHNPNFFILHSCDNRKCCNPNHLREGTQKDNIQDCVKRGRYRVKKGKDSHFLKFTDDQIKKVEELYKTGIYSQRELGAIFGMCCATVCRIVNHKARV